MNINKIFLWGLPYSGKSTLGKSLAQLMGCDFFDLDEVIEHHDGRSIPAIFEEDGEGFFRDLEHQYLNQIVMEQDGFVLSTGGGTPCFYNNARIMNGMGISIYLDVPMDEVYQRIIQDPKKGSRPLLKDLENEKNPVRYLNQKFSHRRPYYEQAQLWLRGIQQDPVALREKINDHIRRNAQS